MYWITSVIVPSAYQVPTLTLFLCVQPVRLYNSPKKGHDFRPLFSFSFSIPDWVNGKSGFLNFFETRLIANKTQVFAITDKVYPPSADKRILIYKNPLFTLRHSLAIIIFNIDKKLLRPFWFSLFTSLLAKNQHFFSPKV